MKSRRSKRSRSRKGSKRARRSRRSLHTRAFPFFGPKMTEDQMWAGMRTQMQKKVAEDILRDIQKKEQEYNQLVKLPANDPRRRSLTSNLSKSTLNKCITLMSLQSPDAAVGFEVEKQFMDMMKHKPSYEYENLCKRTAGNNLGRRI